MTIYVNGEYLPGPKAKISVFDRGLLYGDAVFEGIREYDGKVFKLDEHIDRLYESAQVIALKIPVGKEELKEIILEVLRRNYLRNAHIRPIVTRGCGGMGVDPSNSNQPTLIVFAHEWAPFLGDKGISVKTVSIRRTPPQSIDSRVKHVGYLNNVLAKLEAKVSHADEALILDINGYVAEGPGSNFLIVKDGVVISPTTLNILNGITRRTVLQLADELGYPTEEKNITLGDVYTADEAFMSGTGAEIVPIATVDGRTIGQEAPGEVTCKLISAFRELVKREGTPVY